MTSVRRFLGPAVLFVPTSAKRSLALAPLVAAHSPRSATVGATRAARLAGIHAASRLTLASAAIAQHQRRRIPRLQAEEQVCPPPRGNQRPRFAEAPSESRCPAQRSAVPVSRKCNGSQALSRSMFGRRGVSSAPGGGTAS